MWTLTFEGRTVRTDSLTIGELERLERDAGVSLFALQPFQSVTHLRILVRALLAHAGITDPDVSRVRLGDITLTPDDIPVEFNEGIPETGGYAADRWLCQLCPPFTPRQVRDDFTLRDVQLLAAANPKED